MVATTRSRSSHSSSPAQPLLHEHKHKPQHESDPQQEAATEQLQHHDSSKKEGELQAPKDSSLVPASAAPSPYESLRLQRIAENRARMAALGVQKHAANLTSFFKATKTTTPQGSSRAKLKSPELLDRVVRRSERLRHIPPPGFYALESAPPSGSQISKLPLINRPVGKITYRNYRDMETMRPANAPLPKNCPADLKVSPALSAYRCRNKERGTLYDAIVGICCHFCRQKKLCGEENCERCGKRDVSKPCIGKTDCSRCHSSTGVFCRACLKIRYGEEIQEVRQKHDWLCPHCVEDQGSRPYWICNSQRVGFQIRGALLGGSPGED